MKYSLIIFILMFGFTLSAQDEVRKNIYYGNKLYKKQDFKGALDYYQKAVDESEFNFKANYNLANAYFRLKEYDKAIERYNKIKEYGPTKADKVQVFHNLGNAYLSNNKIDEAIEAYKSALRLMPTNEETRYNLAYALEMKKQQQQQQQQQNQDNKDKKDQQDKGDKGDQQDKGDKGDQQDKGDKGDQQDKGDKGDQQDKGDQGDQQDKGDNGDQQDDGNQGDKDQQNDGENGDSSDEKGQQNKQQNSISKEQAKRILDAALKKEKELQNQMNKGKIIKGEKGKPKKKKDW